MCNIESTRSTNNSFTIEVSDLVRGRSFEAWARSEPWLGKCILLQIASQRLAEPQPLTSRALLRKH